MSLRILTGRAGSGKTHMLMSEAAAKAKAAPIGKPLWLFTPDQATFVTERELLQKFDLAGSFRIRALGFHKLHTLLAGENTKRRWLTDAGRNMLLEQLVSGREAGFKVFGKAANRPGFIAELAAVIAELECYKISPEMLFAAAEQLDNQLIINKLQDIAPIYQEYLELLGDDYLDEALLLQETAELILSKEENIAEEVWVDGFTNFDAAQFEVITALLRRTERLTVALCMDEQHYGENSVFSMAEKSFKQLIAFAHDNDIAVEVVHLDADRRFADQAALKAVEESFSRRYFRPRTGIDVENVSIVRCRDFEEELAFVAAEIWRLCREDGYRLSDCAVITRQLPDVLEDIEKVFAEYELPFYADCVRNIKHHALFEFLAAALAVIDTDWSSPAVLRWLKSGFAPVGSEQMDRIENYALEQGIKGSLWRQAGEWKRRPGKLNNRVEDENAERDMLLLAQLNGAAEVAVAPLLRLERRYKKIKDGSRLTIENWRDLLLKLLAEVNAAEKLEAWAAAAEERGEHDVAGINRRALAAAEALLNELQVFLSGKLLGAAELADLLASGASALKLGFVPPALDQVMAADIGRSRLGRVKAAFVVGCNEGTFPLRIAEEGLLNSLEREQLAALGIALAPGKREQQFEEDYSIYIALTRADSKLYVSFSDHKMSAGKAEGCNASPLVRSLLQVFPTLSVNAVQDTAAGRGLFRVSALLSALGDALADLKKGKEIDPVWLEVLAYLEDNELYAGRLQRLKTGLTLKRGPEQLSAEQVDALYGSPRSSSVSRIEVFNSCPCKYFTRYGLKIEPRPEFTVRTADIGDLYHAILAEVLAALAAEKTDWAALSYDLVLPRVKRAFDNFAENSGGGFARVLAETAGRRYQQRRLLHVVTNTLLDIASHLACGDFVPVEFEVGFGPRAGIKGLKLELPDGRNISLNGYIDRIDKASADGKDYYRIIDYKLANKDLSVSDIYHGLNWQLPVYLAALLEHYGAENARAAGMFYLPVRELMKSVNDADESGDDLKLQGLAVLDTKALQLAERDLQERKKARTMNVSLDKDNNPKAGEGAVDPFDYELISAFVKKQVGEKLCQMLDGDIGMRPFEKDRQPHCEFCDYAPICRLENELDPQYRSLRKLKAADALAMMRREVFAQAEEAKADGAEEVSADE